MCRLFGLIANKEVDVKFSMLEASNNFKKQAKRNPDGWGIGWYVDGKAEIFKRGEDAFCSDKFDYKVKGVRSKIVIAHVRYASSGSSNSDINAHPFIYNNWIFAHNGTVNKDRICKFLKEPFDQNFTSEPIDSEIYFRFILQCIEEEADILTGIKKAVKEIIDDSKGANFILSDGEQLYCFRHGRDLFFLVRDPSCGPVYETSKETQMLIESKRIANEKAVIVATEKITSRENWKEIKENSLIICKENLEIQEEKI